MDGVRRLDGKGSSSRTDMFEVEGMPDLFIEKGTDRGKSLRPTQVRVTWQWPDDNDEKPSPKFWMRWEAEVFGHRVLQTGKLGAELWFLFEPNNYMLPRPAWLLDLVREFGPNGWSYRDH